MISRVFKHRLLLRRQSSASKGNIKTRDGAEYYDSISIFSFNFLLPRNALELKLGLYKPPAYNMAMVPT